jgi:hypothetical protein
MIVSGFEKQFATGLQSVIDWASPSGYWTATDLESETDWKTVTDWGTAFATGSMTEIGFPSAFRWAIGFG